MTKLALFVFLLLLGAINLLYVRPRMSSARAVADQRHRWILNLLQVNVAIEIVLATLVMVIVGILGLMPPAIE